MLALLLALLAADVPDLLNDRWGRVSWMAAELALDENRHVRMDLLGEQIEQAYAVARHNGQSETCKRSNGQPIPEDFKRLASLPDLVAESELILSARVTAVRQGFIYGRPGTLLRLEGTTFKGTKRPVTYLFYEYARIPSADGLYCATPLSPYAPPSVGDRMLVFSFNDAEVIGVDQTRQLVHDSTQQGLLVPKALRNHGQTFDHIEASVAAWSRK